MPLKRASCQSSKSLEGFYKDVAASEDSISSGVGRGMLELLPLLYEFCASFEVWGLTSHYHLWLLASDSPSSRWLVSITSFAVGYQIQYRMPETDAPWPDALVEGHSVDAAEACRLILIAMKRSGGWVAT
jgi:hypothetical protein